MLDVALFFVICYIYNTRFCTIIETEEFKEMRKTREVVVGGASSMTFASTLMTLFYSLSLVLIYLRCTLLLITTSSVPRCALATP